MHAGQVIFCKILIVPGYKSNPGCKSTPTLSPSIFSRKRSTYNRKNTVLYCNFPPFLVIPATLNQATEITVACRPNKVYIFEICEALARHWTEVSEGCSSYAHDSTGQTFCYFLRLSFYFSQSPALAGLFCWCPLSLVQCLAMCVWDTAVALILLHRTHGLLYCGYRRTFRRILRTDPSHVCQQ